MRTVHLLIAVLCLFGSMLPVTYVAEANADPAQPVTTLQHDDDVGSCEEDEIDHDEYENQVVIKLLDPTALHVLNDIASTLNLRIVDTVLASQGIYLLEVADGSDAEDLDDAIEAGWGTQIVYVEANYIGDIPEANPRGFWSWGGDDPTPGTSQYAGQLLNLSAAHTASTGEGIVVAIIDTGIQSAHPSLDGKVIAGYDFVDDDTSAEDIEDGADSDGDGIPNEAVGHGTHIAGIVHYVAPDAQLMPLRVLDGDGAGNLFLIAEAIRYAADNGADIISLSLGSTFESDVLEDAIEYAVDQHQVLIVAAAGNKASSQRQYPAGFDNKVLAVTAIDENSVKAGSANYGCWVDIAAPGEAIFSTFPVDTYAWWSGTSMATPFIAGEAALIMSTSPQRQAPADVMATIKTAVETIESQNPTFVGQLGVGRPNFATALNVAPTHITLQQQSSASGNLASLPLIVVSLAVLSSLTLVCIRYEQENI